MAPQPQSNLAPLRAPCEGWDIQVFFDGACPLCKRDIAFVRSLDSRRRIWFTDIAAPDFSAEPWGTDMPTLMARLRGRLPDGSWVEGVEVFRRMYRAAGLGWLSAITRLPPISWLLAFGYTLFARNRLRITGRCDRQGCEIPAHGGRPAVRHQPLPSRCVVTGATGLVGRALLPQLDRPTVLTRDPSRAALLLGDRPTLVPWAGAADHPQGAHHDQVAAQLEGAAVVFHLAGESVGERRWSAEQKRRIYDSRVLGTRALVAAMAKCKQPPKLLICGSAVGFYGSRGDTSLDEQASPGDDFLARTCVDWEAEAAKARELGVRVVTLRTGVVLDGRSGALPRVVKPFRWGVGGRLGAGHQWLSWIHIDDLIGLLLHIADTPQIEGPVNAVAPTPCRNRELTRAVGKALHRPALFPVPAPLLRLVLGEFASAGLLASQRAHPEVAQRSGYDFAFPTIEEALADLVG